MIVRSGIILLVFSILIGCERSKPYEQAVIDLRKATCRNFNILDAAPFVSENSKPLLNQVSKMAELGAKMEGRRLDDIMSQECTKPTKIIKSVRVNDSRYIVSYLENTTGAEKRAAVISENGSWKVDFTSKVSE